MQGGRRRCLLWGALGIGSPFCVVCVPALPSAPAATGDHIGNEGAKYVAEALKANTTVQTIDLSCMCVL